MLAPLALGGCRERASSGATTATRPAPSAAATTRSTGASASASASASARANGAASASASSSGSASSVGDGGTPQAEIPEECRLLRRPQRLAHLGPATFAFARDRSDPATVFNLRGTPAAAPLATAAGGAGPGLLTPPGGDAPEAAAPNPCAVGGAWVYCMDAEGAVRRRRLGEEGGVVVASAIPGSPIAAAAVGERAVLVFLAPRRTTEGLVRHAFAVLDDGAPVQLSEEGSGATNVALAARGTELFAMYIDARVALTPVHVRRLDVRGTLELGVDAVVLIAGGADGSQTGALGTVAHGPVFVLVPTTTEDAGFGLAVVRIADEPKDDMPVVWSRYPADLRGAPVAATQGRSSVAVLRVRPQTAVAGGRQLLELGRLDDAGEHHALCEIADSEHFQHVSLAVGASGTLWLGYATLDGTFVEQRGKAP